MNRVCLFILTFLLAIFFSAISEADSTYRVKKGDSFTKIAKKYRISVNDLASANNVDPRRLKPGMEIVIPSRTTANHNASGHTVNAVDTHGAKHGAGTQKKPHADPLYHTVKKGDSLSSISRAYAIPIDDLMSLNDLRSTRLKIGQKILVSRPDADEYTVRKGDTIWKIARMFDIDPDVLIAMNGLGSDVVKPGQKILLRDPSDVAELKHYEAVLSQAPEPVDNEQPLFHGTEGASSVSERLILFAKKMLNIPYRFGGNSMIGIDCSAFVKRVYAMIGVDLPRSAREQFNEGVPVDENNLSIGDLVFFRTYASYPSHVGIYLGNNLFIHASSKSRKVTIDSLDTPFYVKRFIGAKRVLDLGVRSNDPENDS